MGLQILGFLGLDDLIFIILFLIVFLAFLSEFKLTKRNSWIVLAGLMAFGGFFVWQTWRRKRLLEEFRQREKALKEIEDNYKELREKALITEQAYQKAMEELERAKVEAGLSIMRADKELAKKLEEIEREFENLTPEESVKKIHEALAGS